MSEKFIVTTAINGITNAVGSMLALTSASVYQERNLHNLMSDFIDEIPCYTQMEKLIELLDDVDLAGNPHDDVIRIYDGLFDIGIVKREEVSGVRAWIQDCTELGIGT